MSVLPPFNRPADTAQSPQLTRGRVDVVEVPAPRTWEYLTVSVEAGEDDRLRVAQMNEDAAPWLALRGVDLQEALTFLGAERWELVSLTPAHGGQPGLLMVFKRETLPAAVGHR